MFSGQQLLTLFLILTMELSLASCGAEGTTQPTPEMARTPGTGAGNTGACTCAILGTRAGGHGGNRDLSRHPNGQCTPCPEGDIHYHIYVPDGYNGSKAYALFLTLPGYEGLYFQGMGRSLYSENFAFEALNYNDHMIVAVPQLSGLGETSIEQTIALTEYLLGHYNIDQERV